MVSTTQMSILFTLDTYLYKNVCTFHFYRMQDIKYVELFDTMDGLLMQ